MIKLFKPTAREFNTNGLGALAAFRRDKEQLYYRSKVQSIF